MAFSISRTSNFYIKKLSADIDSAIVGLASNDNATKKIFSTMTPNGNCCAGDSSTDPVNPVFIRSTTCWAKNIDTSPISPWNNGGGYAAPENAGGQGGSGTLISPRHIVMANHFRIKIGKKLIFVDMNNTCYIRTLTNSLRVGTTDIQIGVLDSDLPSNVSFCQVPSLDLSQKITSNIKIPLFYSDQNRAAFIGNTNNETDNVQFLRQSDDTQRAKFWYTLVGGDSGNPACFVYNNKLILLLHFIYANGGFCAPFYINEINSVMDTLGGGYNLSIFNTEDIDPIVNSISVKTTNTGGGKIIAKPSDIPLTQLQLWLKADAGIIEELITLSFISEIVLTDSGESTSDGTYIRSTGGTTQFDGPNGNYIYWDGAWIVYDNDLGIETYVNYEFYLDITSWEENGSAGAPSAANTTSTLPPFRGITSWQDQSRNNRNFTKSIANTGYPKLSNGIPLFTAVSTYNDTNASILALPSASLNFTTPYTLIVLLRSGPGKLVVFSKSTNNTKRRKYQISMDGGVIYSLESKNNADTSFNYNTGTGDYRKRLIVSQYSSNTSGLIRYNGAQVATSSTDVGIDQTNNASIFIGASPFNEGIAYNAEASNEMHVYEIIFYNRVLSTVEIEKIETYLNNKYPSICGFQNTSKLAETSGSNAPIGAVFNNIAFDYASFASNCSALGLDPTTILNSLGGVDFSYKYVVIRAKTSSAINDDLISDLGGGIINITNVNPSGGSINKYYRFFVMCREGWNTVRFYGVDYPI